MRAISQVETLRKPSTGLKRHCVHLGQHVVDVETLRKPSTGLKHIDRVVRELDIVETLRKPSTGLKQIVSLATE